VSLVESLFAAQGLSDFLHLDYDLMALDAEAVELAPPFPNLRLRYAEARDLAELLPLQAAYEREEVIPEGGGFDPARCLLSLEHIMRRERLLLAQGPSQIIGKINTNAASFSRYQIGGVYVRPEYRARGIASFMAAAFTRDLRRLGRGLTLFVKQCNPAAQAVYRRIGFQIIAAYRISYPRHLPWRRIGRAKG
jgi:predicted GNAT family acetyltransferase